MGSFKSVFIAATKWANFTYESRRTLKSYTLFISVKAITKVNLGHIDKSEIKVHVLQTLQNLVISRSCFAEDGREMYPEL